MADGVDRERLVASGGQRGAHAVEVPAVEAAAVLEDEERLRPRDGPPPQREFVAAVGAVGGPRPLDRGALGREAVPFARGTGGGEEGHGGDEEQGDGHGLCDAAA